MLKKNIKTNNQGRYFAAFFIIGALIVGGFLFWNTAGNRSNNSPEMANGWQKCTHSSQKCQQLVIQHLEAAKKSIRLQAHRFNDPDIGKALIQAHHRHVHIEVIVDDSNLKTKNPLLKDLITNKICLRIEKIEEKNHTKIIIVDDHTLITHSPDYQQKSKNPEAENIFISHDPLIVTKYMKEWQQNWDSGINPFQVGCRVKLTPLKG